MKRAFAFALLLALGACNRHGVADITLDAAAAQRNTTAAKTLSDLQAAEQAAQGPVPTVRDVPPAATARTKAEPAAPAPVENMTEAPDDTAADADTNE